MPIDPKSEIAGGYFVNLESTGLTNFIYILLLLMAIVSAIIAFFTWRAASRHNANEHVHRLFNEYLRFRFEHDGFTEKSRQARGSYIDDNITGMKLYILEEMYNWVLIQANLQSKIGRFQFENVRISINDNINSWKNTIIVHAMQDLDATRQGISDYACCYSIKFIEFIAIESRDEFLLALAQAHRSAAKTGRRRPLGSREQDLFRTTPS